MNITIILLIVAALLIGIVIGRISVSLSAPKTYIPRSSRSLSMSERNEVIQLLQTGRKIEAIKRYRQFTGVGLQQALQEIEQLQNS